LKMVPTESLEAGDVGYVAANIRDIREVPVGDTMTSAVRPTLYISQQREAICY